MEAIVGPFEEGWALGKYSGKLPEKSTKSHTEFGKLKYGKLVNDYKYESFKLDEEAGKALRSSVMLDINEAVDYFLNGYFPHFIRNFDTVVAVPSSRGSTLTIQEEVCEHLRQSGVFVAKNTVYVKSRTTEPTKNIVGMKKRLKSVETNYELGETIHLRKAKGLLLIDDIYETGATLRTTVALLNQVVPDIPKYFLTIAYII
jgi:predicted amidophosphoribosyltransferase